MKLTLCAAALTAVATLTLSGCVTGVDPQTKTAMHQTLESVQELTDLWRARLDDLDGGTGGATIELTGSAEIQSYDLVDDTTFETWSHTVWGVSADTGDGEPLFSAWISGSDLPGAPASYVPYNLWILGATPSLDNPVGYGTATWTGKVRAYETEEATFGTPVEGDAKLQMDLDSILDTIDVDFTNFDRGHANMGWNSVFVNFGSFRSFLHGDLEGEFYGDKHEGVAGTFERDDLKGVFGAVRE